MWGHKRKVRGHIKKFSAGALRRQKRRHCAPHLQIASDATGYDISTTESAEISTAIIYGKGS